MESIEKIYNENKLLVRAMDWPILSRNGNEFQYDCTEWANEFELLTTSNLNSASSTLIIPNIGISTYKNIGFLINSDYANCFHISPSDSSSKGNLENGDFVAAATNFKSLEELVQYIKEHNSRTMNEINIVTNIDSVVGLVANKCEHQMNVLSKIYVIQKFLKHMLNIEYPIYLYDANIGALTKVNIDEVLEEEIISNLKTKNIFYWPDNYDEPVLTNIDNIRSKTL